MSQSFQREAAGGAGGEPGGPKRSPALGPSRGQMGKSEGPPNPQFSSSFVDIFSCTKALWTHSLGRAPFAGGCRKHRLHHQVGHKSGLPDLLAL